ncbi:ferredoxin [Mycobacterium sp. NPDC003449]
MRIEIDDDLCEFHGQCAAVAPQVFALTDEAVEYPHDVPLDQEPQVRTAVKVCPQLAIHVTES